MNQSEEVSSLLEYIQKAASGDKSAEPGLLHKLERLKILGRQPEVSALINEKSGIKILCEIAFGKSNVLVSREALRCVANALNLEPKAQKSFADLGCHNDAVHKLKTGDTDDEFLLCRILWLLTYEKSVDFDQLVESLGLADAINQRLRLHASRYSPNPASNMHSTMEVMALNETLKLLFNLLYHYQKFQSRFDVSLPHVLTILRFRKQSGPPLDPPISFLINALLNLNIEQKHTGSEEFILFPTDTPSAYVERLVDLFDETIRFYPEGDHLDETAMPLTALLRRINEVCPQEVKAYMQKRLLPSDDDRAQPLGMSESLPSRLLKLSTSALSPLIRDSVINFLFELSEKDAAQFVQNVGYGYASGYLMSQNIPIPEEYLGQQDSIANEMGRDSQGRPVNPITGQRIDREEVANMPEMTDEEKEREAERLFVLFERLKQTGVVDIQNPVEAAMKDGRFEELD